MSGESMRKHEHGGGGGSIPSSAATEAPRVGNVIMNGQPQQHQQQSAFLPEPFPTASRANNTKTHFHDAFGDNDSGVDYGPPNEYEDDDNAGSDDDDDDDDDNDDDESNQDQEEYDDEERQKAAMNQTEITDLNVEDGLDHPTDPDDHSVGSTSADDDHFVSVTVGATTDTTDVTTTEQYEHDQHEHEHHTTIITIEELEEEVGLHETTLESLSSKLQKLNADIQTEERNSTSLKSDIQLLNQRKLIFRKRTDNNMKLVQDLEGSLDKCLERLRRALDALISSEHVDPSAAAVEAHRMAQVVGDGDEGELAINVNNFVVANDAPASSGEGGIPVENVTVSSGVAVESGIMVNDDDRGIQVQETAENSTHDDDEQKTSEDVHAQKEDDYSYYTEVPLNLEYETKQRGQILSWPAPKLVRKIQREAQTLPCDFPTWRTHPLSMPLLVGIDSQKLMVGMMNVAVLEHLLEREEQRQLVGGGSDVPTTQSSGCGWVKGSDIWGTSLDVCAHVNWKHLFAGFRRLDEGRGVAKSSSSAAAAANDGAENDIDPNVILCPYELGGACADDQCPYQHLKKDDNNSSSSRDKMKKMISSSKNNEESCYEEGYIRYNNFPKSKLPRPFVRDDFIVVKKKKRRTITVGSSCQKVVDDTMMLGDQITNGNVNQSTTPNIPENIKRGDGIEQRQSVPNNPSGGDEIQDQVVADNRHFHCPVCLDDKIFNHVELQNHMKERQCNPSSLMVNGNSVSICHVLNNPGEGDGTAYLAFEGDRDDSLSDSDHDSMSAVRVDDGPSGQLNKSEEGDDDASMASQGSDNSARNEYLTSDIEDHSMNADEHIDAGGPSLDQDMPDSRETNNGVEDNLDYVSLPSVDDSTIDGDSKHETRGDNDDVGDEKTIFSDVLWWQQVVTFPGEGGAAGGKEEDTFDSLLLAFGFQRLCVDGKKGTSSHSLRYIMRSSSDDALPQEQKIEDILLFARLIDLSRILVHMGRDSFALSAISSICQSRTNDPYKSLAEGASQSIKYLSHSRCAFAIFQGQIHLLLVSEALHAHYDSFCCENNTINGNAPCLETILDQIEHLNRTKRFTEKNLLPAGFETLRQSLMSRLPSAKNDDSKDGDDDAWAPFVKTLRLMMEKFVVIPFSQLKKNEHVSFLLQAVCIGKSWAHMVHTASAKEHKFAPYLHVLEPIWSALQPMLQSPSGCNIAIVMIGPVIFSCVADTVAPPGEAATSRKLPPKFDARAHANLSSLDITIVKIIKELNRSGRSVEPLMAPLYALSASICVALGSFEKAHLRLEHVLNKESGSSTSQPSIYALSELMWSQLLQIRMICPSYSVPLQCTGNVADRLGKPSLPDEILGPHNEMASRIVGNGIFLHGVKLRGDSHMNIISPCFNQMQCKEWDKTAMQIFTNHPIIEADGSQVDGTLSTVEFCISNPYPEVNGTIGRPEQRHDLDGVKCRASVFPESLLLLGNTLTYLSLKKSRLTRLPLSIGFHFSSLQSLNLSNNLLCELPSSICCMTGLEVLNVSHNKLKSFPTILSNCSNLRVLDVSFNQLTSFPSDLALQCHNLQSFIVDGNILPPPEKRQKIASDSLEGRFLPPADGNIPPPPEKRQKVASDSLEGRFLPPVDGNILPPPEKRQKAASESLEGRFLPPSSRKMTTQKRTDPQKRQKRGNTEFLGSRFLPPSHR